MLTKAAIRQRSRIDPVLIKFLKVILRAVNRLNVFYIKILTRVRQFTKMTISISTLNKPVRLLKIAVKSMPNQLMKQFLLEVMKLLLMQLHKMILIALLKQLPNQA